MTIPDHARTNFDTLAGDLSLRRLRVMNDYRVELSGCSEGMRDWLRATGLFTDIIRWKTRFFVPMTKEGPAILDKLMQRLDCSSSWLEADGGAS